MMKNKPILKKCILFIFILIGLRLIWMLSFMPMDQPYAKNGVLDLRHWDFKAGKVLSLDGEWSFYPQQFVLHHDQPGTKPLEHLPTERIHVPGSWSHLMEHQSAHANYGYGTYHLKILIDPDPNLEYALRVASVRSASELYINGRLAGSSGVPASNEAQYTAHNKPYMGIFQLDSEQDTIDIVIHAANFIDPRQSGIIRSMKFGTKNAVYLEVNLSVAMQLLSAIIFVMHALYAVILYTMGRRQHNLVYFALMLVCTMLLIMLSNEAKLLSFVFPIGYETGFRMSFVLMLGALYFLLQSTKQFLPETFKEVLLSPPQNGRFGLRLQHKLKRLYSKKRLMWAYSLLYGGIAIVSLLLPFQSFMVQIFQKMQMVISLHAVIHTLFAIFRAVRLELPNHRLFLFSFIAFGSHFIWWSIYLGTGLNLIYYPFDLIISIVLYALIWFQNYFQTLNEAHLLTEKLQESNKRKDEFLVNTSHELRNPLHGILNITQAILEREQHQLNEQSIKDMEMLLTVGRRMSFLLNDLLDLRRLQENIVKLEVHPVLIQNVVAGVMDILRFMTHDKPIKLVNHISSKFPPVLADQNRLIQILFNLLHNAVKFTNEGEVVISGAVQDGKAMISISDTGIGLDQEMIKRIFEPYEQREANMLNQEGGFGLGLSICKQLVELHGSQLSVSSNPGQGTTFTFTLECATDSETVLEPAELSESLFSLNETSSTPHIEDIQNWKGIFGAYVTEQERNFQANASRPRILAVDDDPLNLKILINILTIENYEVFTASSGAEALHMLDSKNLDLIIADVMMPEMSGYELTTRIRERYSISELPILLLTARSQAADVHSGFLAGANDYVTKPVDGLELRARVRALTDLRSSINERLRLEAAYLQAQMQPHFLFNTLNSITALSNFDLEKMNNLINAFGSYLRLSFDFSNSEQLVPIDYELALIRSYLYIEKQRFEDRLEVVWDVDIDHRFPLPPLTIQPLVENAVRHGVLKRSQGGVVKLRIKSCNNKVVVTVEDNGVGIEASRLPKLLDHEALEKRGIGLLNTDRRLKQIYGTGLTIDSVQDKGTRVSFVISKVPDGGKR